VDSHGRTAGSCWIGMQANECFFCDLVWYAIGCCDVRCRRLTEGMLESVCGILWSETVVLSAGGEERKLSSAR